MTNFNELIGIRFGVISPHSISSEALNDIYMTGTDPHYQCGIDEITRDYKNECEESEMEFNQDVLDSRIQDFSDSYCNPDGQMDYSDTEYDLHVSGDNFGIFVMRSPYYTYCRSCSPCAPGAGDLDTPYAEWPDMDQCDKTLCLGPEWFDTEKFEYSRKIPYRVFRVDDDVEVVPE